MEQNRIVCISCTAPFVLKEKTFFCPKCLKQIRCKSCSSILEKDAIGCIECGTPLDSSKEKKDAVNKIEYEQKGDSKKFVASFTNTIGENLVHSLGNLFGSPNYKLSNSNPFARPSNSSSANFTSKKIDGKQPETAFDDAIVLKDFNDAELGEALQQIFRMEDDRVVLINSRVKHSGKLDQAIRITLLLLYAYSSIDQRQIKRSTLSQILNHTKLYDSHLKKWLAKCDEITKLDNGDTLELSMPGITVAKEILLEFLDASIDKGRVQFSTSQRRATKKRNSKKDTHEDSKDGTERTRKTASSSAKESPLQTVELLISENYFSSKRRISEIIAFIKDNKGIIIPRTNMSTVLVRLIKNGKIKREKNPTDGQYEYYK